MYGKIVVVLSIELIFGLHVVPVFLERLYA